MPQPTPTVPTDDNDWQKGGKATLKRRDRKPTSCKDSAASSHPGELILRVSATRGTRRAPRNPASDTPPVPRRPPHGNVDAPGVVPRRDGRGGEAAAAALRGTTHGRRWHVRAREHCGGQGWRDRRRRATSPQLSGELVVSMSIRVRGAWDTNPHEVQADAAKIQAGRVTNRAAVRVLVGAGPAPLTQHT